MKKSRIEKKYPQYDILVSRDEEHITILDRSTNSVVKFDDVVGRMVYCYGEVDFVTNMFNYYQHKIRLRKEPIYKRCWIELFGKYD